MYTKDTIEARENEKEVRKLVPYHIHQYVHFLSNSNLNKMILLMEEWCSAVFIISGGCNPAKISLLFYSNNIMFRLGLQIENLSSHSCK